MINLPVFVLPFHCCFLSLSFAMKAEVYYITREVWLFICESLPLQGFVALSDNFTTIAINRKVTASESVKLEKQCKNNYTYGPRLGLTLLIHLIFLF